MYLLRLKNVSILDQLHIEEALLRADDGNWCLYNEGSSKAIVMGISGKYGELVDANRMQQAPIPVIRRFSGGGTVIVDEQTSFVTLMGHRNLLDFPCYPQPLLKWTEMLYAEAFEGLGFALKDQDYVLGNKKFGGNAQYITKDRWLHHTSFLWDYCDTNMSYLLMPKKTPVYREGRDHNEFLCRLKTYFSSREELQNKILDSFKQHFKMKEVLLEDISPQLAKRHRRSTELIELEM